MVPLDRLWKRLHEARVITEPIRRDEHRIGRTVVPKCSMELATSEPHSFYLFEVNERSILSAKDPSSLSRSKARRKKRGLARHPFCAFSSALLAIERPWPASSMPNSFRNCSPWLHASLITDNTDWTSLNPNSGCRQRVTSLSDNPPVHHRPREKKTSTLYLHS